MKILDPVFILLQRVVPQHWLSMQMHKLMRCEIVFIKNFLIKTVIKLYKIDLGIAVEPNPENYLHFNDFFVRKLQSNTRPISSQANSITSPVDGAVSQIGLIDNTQLFQAKGKTYSLSSLLAQDQANNQANDQNLADKFTNGHFATLYLSPRDYHRIHMSLDGTLKKMIYVPGDLFAVNQLTVHNVSDLFARNERTIIWFETEAGPMVMILVGAIFVGSMETIWHEGMITPPYGKEIQTWNYDANNEERLLLKKGEEMGRFNMGSTVILLFGKDQISWSEELQRGSSLQMGQLIGKNFLNNLNSG